MKKKYKGTKWTYTTPLTFKGKTHSVEKLQATAQETGKFCISLWRLRVITGKHSMCISISRTLAWSTRRAEEKDFISQAGAYDGTRSLGTLTLNCSEIYTSDLVPWTAYRSECKVNLKQTTSSSNTQDCWAICVAQYGLLRLVLLPSLRPDSINLWRTKAFVTRLPNLASPLWELCPGWTKRVSLPSRRILSIPLTETRWKEF